MESILISIILGAVTTAVTQLAKRTKVDARLVVCMISLCVAALYALIGGFYGKSFLDALLYQGVTILGTASTIYAFFSKHINKVL